MWGTKSGRTSSDSAFDHNLQQEVGELLGENTCTILLDMSKCYEMVDPHALLQEGRAFGFSMRLLWMLACSYQQPRRIRAFGSVSVGHESFQWILAGCTHATFLLYLLTYRAVRRANQVSATITPRTLMDDIGLQSISSAPEDLKYLAIAAKGFVHDSKGLRMALKASKSGGIPGKKSVCGRPSISIWAP